MDTIMAEIHEFPDGTQYQVDPDEMLEEAKGQYERVVIVGIMPDNEMQVAFSTPDHYEATYWLGKAESALKFPENYID